MTEPEHDLVVLGMWRNDDAADVGVWCNTCSEWIAEGDDDEGLPVEEVARVAAEHRGEQP